MTIPSYLSTEIYLQNSLTKQNSKLNREFPSRSLRRSEESRALKSCYDIACLICEVSSVEPCDRTKRRKTITLIGRLKKVFSVKQLGLVQEGTLEFFLHTHATGDRDDNVE